MFSKSTSLTALVLSATVSATVASTQELFPVVDDYMQHEGLPNDGRFSILDFSLLQQLGAIRDAAENNGYDILYTSTHETRGLTNGKGLDVSFNYGPSHMKLSKDVPTGFDVLNIKFTSNLTGNRVSSIMRGVEPEQAYDFNSLTDSLKAKFGEPSLITELPPYSVEYQYFFHAGEQIMSPDQTTWTPRIRECRYMRNNVPWGEATAQYQFKEQRQKNVTECSGAIEIKLNLGARSDLVDSMQIIVYDYDLVHKDLVAQDQFLVRSLEEKANSQVGTSAPKL